jgi:macrolide-specific efflux system membrane fusion protein
MLKTRLIQAGLGLLTVAIVGSTLHAMNSHPKPPPPPTAVVTRGVVLATVSATGNVNADTQLALDFTTGGRLTDLYVREGDHVRRGQPLARVDDGPARDSLAQAQADLSTQQGTLAQLHEGPTPQERRHHQSTVEEARTAVDKATNDLTSAVKTGNQDVVTKTTTVNNARTALDTAKSTSSEHLTDLQNDIDRANERVAQTQDRLLRDEAKMAYDQDQADQGAQREADTLNRLNIDREIQRQIEDQQRRKGCNVSDSKNRTNQPSSNSSTNTTFSAQSADNGDNGDTTTTSKTTTTTSKTTTTTSKSTSSADKKRQRECSNLADQHKASENAIAADEDDLNTARSDRQRSEGYVRDDDRDIQTDKQQLITDTQSLTSAKDALNAGRLADQKTIEDAQKTLDDALNDQATGKVENEKAVTEAHDTVNQTKSSVNTAEANSAELEQPKSNGQIASQEGAVASAQAKVDTAERTLSDTTLVAPADGTIAVISSKLGEQVNGRTDFGSVRSTVAGSAGTTGELAPGSKSGRSGGFITMTDLGTLQIKADFAEADASRVELGQVANVTFDALGGKQVSAHVAAIQAVETVVSNVVTYQVTSLLDNLEPGIEPGMTATVDVVVAEKDNVLRLPISAVTPRNNKATVEVIGPDGKRVPRQITTGLKGDEEIEITGGLQDGDKVVVAKGGGSKLASPTSGTSGGGGGSSSGGRR